LWARARRRTVSRLEFFKNKSKHFVHKGSDILRFKKIVAAFLAFWLVFAVCGCAVQEELPALASADTSLSKSEATTILKTETSTIISTSVTPTTTELVLLDTNTIPTNAEITTATQSDRYALLKPYELNLEKLSEELAEVKDFSAIEFDLSSLDKEAVNQVKLAYVFISNIKFDSIPFTGYFNSVYDSSVYDENAKIFYTGITYDSFLLYLQKIFTNEMTVTLLNDYKYICDIDGELCLTGNLDGGGTNPLYDYGNYSIESADSENINIIFTAHYRDGDVLYDPEYYYIRLIKESNAWKINEFNFWR
jgi:hypothetical protein